MSAEALQREQLADARLKDPASHLDEALLELMAGTLAYFKVRG